ncbi:MAG: hypothetical protein KDA60_16480 [Planctomycetales bacterium]|nr:hypothetical protein [Planctomycetales bacterium]
MCVLLSALAIGKSAEENSTDNAGYLKDLQSSKNLIVYVSPKQNRIFAYSAVTGDSWKLDLDGKLDQKIPPVVSENLAVVATTESVFAFSARNAVWVRLPVATTGPIKEMRIVNDVAQIAFGKEAWFFSAQANRWSGLSLPDGMPCEVEEI